MDCPGCGRLNPEGSLECAHCGMGLPIDPSDDQPTVRSDLSEAPTMASRPGGAPQGPRLEVGQSLGQRYEILEVIGEGGCGVVYKARDRSLDRIVAIKTIHPAVAANPEMLERFKRETLLASQISHRNVVRIHDLGEAGPIQFISMAFIEGSDLKSIIRDEGPLSLERALPLIRQVGEALQAAHDAGVVHRDLKPQNILVDAEGQAFIADFGISRSIDSGQTMTEAGALLGTVAYMSPEQARGETADHRSDIYSFGLIIYEMLTGSPPFESGNVLSQLMKRVESDVPTVNLTRSDLPAWLVRVVARAVARDVERRYQSVEEFLRDLGLRQATRARRRGVARRVLAALAAVVVMALVGVAAWSWWQQRRSEAVPALQASLMVVPFRNVTRDPGLDWTREGLPELLRTQLAQSKSLRLAGGDRVRDIVGRLKPDAAAEYEAGTVLALSRLGSAENVLTADLYRTGGEFRIDARLLRLGASAVASETRLSFQGQGEDSLFKMVDDLGESIRRELGLGRVWGRRTASELSTRSVQALRLHTEAEQHLREGRDLEAAADLEAALEADPEFAVARAQLADLYAGLGRVADAMTQADLAAAGLGRVSPYEAARIRAVRATLGDDVEAARRAYAELCRLAPNQAEPHVARASLLESLSDLDGAFAALNRALELDPRNPTALFARGRVQAKRGETGGAIVDFTNLLAYHTETGNEEGRATVLNGLGNVYRHSAPDRALENYRQSLGIRRVLGDLQGASKALNNIAMVQQDQGQLDAAIATMGEVLATRQQLDDRMGLADAYANLGDIFALAGRAEEALEAYRQNQRLLQGSGDDVRVARALGNLGYIYQILGNYGDAFLMLSQALSTRRELGLAGDLVMALNDIGSLAIVQGRFDDALKYLGEGLDLARDSDSGVWVTSLQINVGMVHFEMGNYGAALPLIDTSCDAARETANLGQLATCSTWLGAVRRALGDHDAAAAAIDEALALARKLETASLEAEALIQQGLLQLDADRRPEAAESFRSAAALAGRTGEHRLQLWARIGTAAATAAIRPLRSARDEAQQAGLASLEGLAGEHLADALLAREDPQALPEASRNADNAQALKQVDRRFVAETVAAAALHRKGAEEQAATSLRSAMDALEALRRGLPPGALETFLARRRTRAFAELARAVLADPADGARLAALLGP